MQCALTNPMSLLGFLPSTELGDCSIDQLQQCVNVKTSCGASCPCFASLVCCLSNANCNKELIQAAMLSCMGAGCGENGVRDCAF